MKKALCLLLCLLLAPDAFALAGEILPAPGRAANETDAENGEELDVMTMEANGQTFAITLEDNDTARALEALLPLTLDMRELNGNEKYFYLDEALPAAAQAVGRIEAGDVMLFGDSCLVIFYESFSTAYSYTRIGRIDNPEGLAEALGGGSVTVTLGGD